MQALAVLLVIYLFVVLVIMPIWLLVKFSEQNRDFLRLREQLRSVESELRTLRAEITSRAALPATTPAVAQPMEVPVIPSVTSPAWIPPVAPPAVARLEPTPTVVPFADTAPPVLPPALPVTPAPAYVPPPPRPAINWEQFMGAKLFAWLGGLALFFGVAFFLKYSFEHGWIPAQVRVTMGFLFGAALSVGGLILPRAKYAITAQTLIGTGVVSLYAVTFVCGKDHYNFLGPVAMLLMMSLVTTTAFVLAVRLNAPVVAILGMLGGFLTPPLLSTGVDNPGGLFGYLALLDIGLVAVVLVAGWRYLIPLSAGGTVILMLGWADRFFVAAKGPTAMIVCLGFSILYQVAAELARRRDRSSPEFSWTAAALPLVGYGFAFYFLSFPELAARAALFFGYVLLVDAILLVQSWRDEAMPKLHFASGFIAFALLGEWTGTYLTDSLLSWTLAAFLVFAALHTVFSQLLQRRRPATTPSWWSQIFPPLTLLLMILPLVKLDSTSLLIWPAILLVDLLAIGAAILCGSLAVTAAVLVLTLVATGVWIFKVPAGLGVDSSLLLVIGGFAGFFFVASAWAARRLGSSLLDSSQDRPVATTLFGDARTQLPAFSAVLPFILLIMVCLRLNVTDPSSVFGLGLLLVILTLGVARLAMVEWLPACALVGVAALEFSWHSRHFNAEHAGLPLAWYLAFYAVFAIYPFLFRRHFASLTGPWAVAALSGVAHFYMAYRAIKLSWPSDFLGAIPALFAIAPLLGLVATLRARSADEKSRLNQLAWFGGVTLFFITLIFPIQFERQWLTVAWALEGAALAWLFHRVPHPGLRVTGVALLVIAFVRLAMNQAVLSYHVRSDMAVFNWYLYAYGLTITALFFAANRLAPPRDQVLGSSAPPILNTLGVILAFLLLNIEVADYFTAPGSTSLAFQFSGNFAREMSYTIAWALFALALLSGGIWKQARVARYAAIALLCVALFKLFFHDLTRLGQLYRIGAFFAVAIIAILASVAYQRFLPSNEKAPPTP